MKIRIMSYNTQHCLDYIKQEIDYDLIANTIRDCGADIVGLQEIRNRGTRPGYEPQAQILAEKLGFHVYFAQAIGFAGDKPYGNALLSRYPILSAETVKIPDPDPETRTGPKNYESRCLLKARIDVGRGLNFLVTHFGLNPDEEKNAVETVLPNLTEERCVLMGDFNVDPEAPVLDPLRQRLYDTAQHFPCPRLSYPSDMPRQKLDYIFVSRDIKVLSADIPEIVSSDHRPHVAEIELAD